MIWSSYGKVVIAVVVVMVMVVMWLRLMMMLLLLLLLWLWLDNTLGARVVFTPAVMNRGCSLVTWYIEVYSV